MVRKLDLHESAMVPYRSPALAIIGFEGAESSRPIPVLADLRGWQVEIAGIAKVANGLWMSQIARNLTDAEQGILTGKGYLIHDRDPLFTAEFLNTITDAGVKSVKLPPQSPNLNAYAERFVRSIKESCLERMIFFGEESLRTAIQNFVSHYHSERNHQGLANRLISPEPGPRVTRARSSGASVWAAC